MLRRRSECCGALAAFGELDQRACPIGMIILDAVAAVRHDQSQPAHVRGQQGIDLLQEAADPVGLVESGDRNADCLD